MTPTDQGTRDHAAEGQRGRDRARPPRPPDPAGLLPMDPRIRRRRIEVRRDEGRRRLHILLGCVGVMGALATAAGLVRSPLFDVDHVDVRGAERTPRAAIVAAGRLGDTPPLMDVDTDEVARRVEALPWVLDATARKDWPATVRVDVTERRPAAVLPAGEGLWALADRTGRVLAVGTDKPAELPVLGNLPAPGPPGSRLDPAGAMSLRVAAALPAPVRARVADVATTPDGREVELQLTPPGGVVRIGPPVRLAAKLRVLETLLTRADLAGVAVLDLRVPRAPALTRR